MSASTPWSQTRTAVTLRGKRCNCKGIPSDELQLHWGIPSMAERRTKSSTSGSSSMPAPEDFKLGRYTFGSWQPLSGVNRGTIYYEARSLGLNICTLCKPWTISFTLCAKYFFPYPFYRIQLTFFTGYLRDNRRPSPERAPDKRLSRWKVARRRPIPCVHTLMPSVIKMKKSLLETHPCRPWEAKQNLAHGIAELGGSDLLIFPYYVELFLSCWRV